MVAIYFHPALLPWCLQEGFQGCLDRGCPRLQLTSNSPAVWVEVDRYHENAYSHEREYGGEFYDMRVKVKAGPFVPTWRLHQTVSLINPLW